MQAPSDFGGGEQRLLGGLRVAGPRLCLAQGEQQFAAGRLVHTPADGKRIESHPIQPYRLLMCEL